MNQIKKQILKTLKELSETYEAVPIALHLGIALDGYGNIENVTDKELLFALQKYSTERELNDSIPHRENVEDIIEDANHLSIEDIYDEEDPTDIY